MSGWQCAVFNTLSTAEFVEASHLDTIAYLRSLVPAAEVRKAEDAGDDARRMPRPPFLTGRLAWIHWTSVRSMLVIVIILPLLLIPLI